MLSTNSKENEIAKLLSDLGFKKDDKLDIVWRKENIEISTDYQIGLTITLNFSDLVCEDEISLVHNPLFKDDIKKTIKIFEQIENEYNN